MKKFRGILLLLVMMLALVPAAFAQDYAYTVDSVYFSDLSGNVILNPGISCVVNAKVTKQIERLGEDVVVIAGYATDGSMIGFTTVGGTMDTGKTYTFSTLIPSSWGKSIDTVKAYVWNNISEMEPLSAVYQIILNEENNEEESSELYGIALDVTSDDYLNLVLADGTTKSYALESGAIKDTAGIVGGVSETALRTYLNTAADASDRIVKYKVRNSSGEIMSIDIVDTSAQTTWTTADEFKSRTNRLGSAEILSTTPVIDARKAVADPQAGSNYSKFDVTSFKDGIEYKFVAIKTGTYTNFVVLNAISSKMDADSRFAIVTRGPRADITEDGEEVEVVDVLYHGEMTSLNFEMGAYGSIGLEVGDAFYYDVDSYGYVSEVFIIYDKSENAFIPLKNAITHSGKTVSDYIETDMMNYGTWGYTLSVNDWPDIRLAEAYIVCPEGDWVLSLADAVSPLTRIDTTSDIYSYGDGNATKFTEREDVEIYLYEKDADVVKERDKFRCISGAKLFDLATESLSAYEQDGIYDIANVPGATDMSEDAVYAIVMTVDEEIVEVYAIK